MRVDWSNPALDDIQAIFDYIAQDSAIYAQGFVEQLFASSDRLAVFPYSGRIVPEAENPDIREIIVQSYRVMYRVEASRVLMLSIMHGRRDLASPENQPWGT